MKLETFITSSNTAGYSYTTQTLLTFLNHANTILSDRFSISFEYIKLSD